MRSPSQRWGRPYTQCVINPESTTKKHTATRIRPRAGLKGDSGGGPPRKSSSLTVTANTWPTTTHTAASVRAPSIWSSFMRAPYYYNSGGRRIRHVCVALATSSSTSRGLFSDGVRVYWRRATTVRGRKTTARQKREKSEVQACLCVVSVCALGEKKTFAPVLAAVCATPPCRARPRPLHAGSHRCYSSPV